MSKEKTLTGKWHIETVAINVPIAICGTPVKPGDLINWGQGRILLAPENWGQGRISLANGNAALTPIFYSPISFRYLRTPGWMRSGWEAASRVLRIVVSRACASRAASGASAQWIARASL